MAPDKSTSDTSFADAGDMSSPVETLALDLEPTATSLSDTTRTQENAASGSGLHQPDRIVLEAHPSRDDGVSGWLQWWPVAVFPPTYALHRYYRRHRPRRLPPLTPLKLPGLYGLAFTTTMLFVQQAVVYTEMVVDDKHLHIIDRAGDRAAAILDEPDGQEAFQSFHVEPELAQVFKRIRDEDYHSSGLAGKLAWWDRHVWASQEMFDKWMLILVNSLDERQSIAALPREDLEICATHLANRSSGRATAGAAAWGMGFSIPLAMLARWSGRRALYLPMNGLQRLLLGAWMYVELPITFRELFYLDRIQEKDVAARVMVDLFGSFDEEFEELGIEYEAPPDES
ncbi:hypothetical protein V8D89_004187 [Ganoderma adspersum]